MKSQFKNQISSLQSVFFLLLVVLGVNAFTRTTLDEAYNYDLTEGKILAAEQNYKDSLVPQYLKAQQDYQKMNIDFNAIASQSEVSNDSLPQLSLISQSLYVYDQELRATKFHTLSLEQRKSFLAKLEGIKKEFYNTVSAMTAEKSDSVL